MDVTLDGETLSPAALLSGSNGLALIRGRWVQVNRERIERTQGPHREGRITEESADDGGHCHPLVTEISLVGE